MKCALLVIKKPEKMNPTQINDWDNFSEDLSNKVEKYETAKRLSETILEISLETSLSEFLEIQKSCKKAGYPTITSFLKKFPIWITS